MTINSTKFIYNDEPCEFYNLILVNFDSSTSSNDEESEIILSKTARGYTWDSFGINYTNPLKFQITVCKDDGSFIDAFDQATIKKWLCKKSWGKLQIVQDDLEMIEYTCIIKFANMNDVGRRNAGMTFDVTCDSICAWTPEMYQYYSSTTTSLFDFYNDSDLEECLYPSLKITCNANGTIKLTNESEDNRIVYINNCAAGEVITIDCSKNTLDSSTGRVLIGDWNRKYFRFINGWNHVTIDGNCNIEMTYRFPRRVGG